MIKKGIITLVILFTFDIMLYSYNWNIIADSIATKQKEICDSIYYNKIDIYRNLRKGYNIRKYVDSIAAEGDTIIIMEYHNPYNFTTNCITWIKGKPNSVLIYDKNLNKGHDFTRSYWSASLRKICEDWKVSEIRKGEREHPYEPISPLDKPSIITTRVILRTDNEFLINSIIFDYFED
jgi:hypothetical protein